MISGVLSSLLRYDISTMKLINFVAHRLAHMTGCSRFDDSWLDETLAIIYDVLNADLCICAQGLGVTSPSLHFQNIINNNYDILT